MKRILTASLVAIMAVTAANADIASTQYVNAKAGTDENGVFTFQGVAEGKTNLTEAINAVANKVNSLSADMGDGGTVSAQISSAIGGLDVDAITVEDGKYVKTVSETDGKVSVTTGDLIGQINEDGENKNDTSAVAPTTAAVAGYVKGKMDTVDTKITNALSETKENVTGLLTDVAALQQNSATKTELSEQNTNLTGAIATAKGEAIQAAKEETTSQVSAAKTELEGKINDVVAGGLTDNSVEGTAIKTGTITETQLNGSVNASLDLADSALQKDDIATGTANGTIKVDNVDVAVAGLGTAAYKAEGDFEVAGAAATAETNAKTYTDETVAGLDADVAATTNNVIVGIKEVDGKLTEVTSVQITNDYIAADAAIAKTKLASEVQTSLGKADSAMQLDDLKTADSYTTNGCATAGVICSLVSKGGTIAWEKVVNE